MLKTHEPSSAHMQTLHVQVSVSELANSLKLENLTANHITQNIK